MYVDTAFISGTSEQESLFGLPGEFFAGRFFHNQEDGHVYAQMGKASAALFRLRGWANSTVRPLQMHNGSFSMTDQLIGLSFSAFLLSNYLFSGGLRVSRDILWRTHPDGLNVVVCKESLERVIPGSFGYQYSCILPFWFRDVLTESMTSFWVRAKVRHQWTRWRFGNMVTKILR
jgi:hypothetical protein